MTSRTIAADARNWRTELDRHLDLIHDALVGTIPWHPPRFGDPRLDPAATPDGRAPNVNPDVTPHVPDRTAGPADPTASAANSRGTFAQWVAAQLLEQHDHLWDARVSAFHDDTVSVGTIPAPWHNDWPDVIGRCVRSAKAAADDLAAETERGWARALGLRPSDDQQADAHVDLHVRPWAQAIGDARASCHGLVHTASMPCQQPRCLAAWERARQDASSSRCRECGYRRVKYAKMVLCDACRRRQLRQGAA